MSTWLEARADRLEILGCDQGLSWPAAPVPRFEPRRADQASAG